MDEFTICSCCLSNIDTIYPVLRGSFIPASPSPCSATCDLVLGTSRCCKYLDALTDAAAAAQNTGFRDLRPLANIIETYAAMPECRKGEVVKENCYAMSTISEFTVCPECYRDVVAADAQRGVQLAQQFGSAPTFMSAGFTCQLYSPRMRQVWQEAAMNNDIEYLRHRVQQRVAKELEITAKLDGLAQQCQLYRIQANHLSKHEHDSDERGNSFVNNIHQSVQLNLSSS